MATTKNDPKATGIGCGAIILGVLLLWGCGTILGSSSSSNTSSKSHLACDHFRNVADDASDGLLHDSELRAKLQEVYSNSAIATPAVQAAAKDMLAAATANNPTRLKSAVVSMYAACSADGA